MICIRDYCFEYLDHTADVMIKAYGRNLKHAFYSAAAGMLHLIYDVDKVESDSDYASEVLYDWLSNILAQFYIKKIAFGFFKIKNLRRIKNGKKQWYLKGYAMGEPYSMEKHNFKKEVKAVTWHGLDIKREGRAKYVIEFIVDI